MSESLKTYTVAIIGTGWGTRVQVPCFRRAGYEVTALWVRDLEKGKKTDSQLGIPFVTSNYEEILARKDVDLVIITVPPHKHLEMCKSAVKAGKHVLLEKPMVMNPQEAQDLVSFCNSTMLKDQILILDHELRFLKTMTTMKSLIQSGACGKIFHVEGCVMMGGRAHTKRWNWWYESSKGGGVLGAIGSHVVDSLQYLTNKKNHFCQWNC